MIALSLTLLAGAGLRVALRGSETPTGSVGADAAGAPGAQAAPGAQDAQAPAVPPSTPVLLPDRVAGLEPMSEPADPTREPHWLQQARTASPDSALAARSYGDVKTNQTLRVIVARTDLTGRLDLAWAVDAGQTLGRSRCTQNVKLTANGTAEVRPTVVLCWRTTPTLSVSTVLFTPQRTTTPTEGAAALDEVWNAVTTPATP